MNRIILFKDRDFGELFQDSFQYVFRNAKTLLIPLLIYVVPIVAISGIINAYYSQNMMDTLMQTIQGGDIDNLLEEMVRNNQVMPLWIIPIILVVSMIATGMTGAFIYEHMLVYMQEPDQLEDGDHLRDRAFNSLGKLIGTFLTIAGLTFIAAIGVAIVVGLAAAFTPVLAVILGIIAFFLLCYAMVPISLTYITQLYEDISPIAALRRVFGLIRGYWWMTFGLQFLMSLILGIVSAPVTASLSLSGAMSLPVLIGGQLVIAAVSVLINTPLWVANALQYFNITDQQGPSSYIDDVIDQIGNE
ncbi:MAG: hypothetical protein AAFQ68_00875 [Bacteroidota bacterium]